MSDEEEMIERVARALYEDAPHYWLPDGASVRVKLDWDDCPIQECYLDSARVAIEAMRLPASPHQGEPG